jgi:hypothetical protein
MDWGRLPGAGSEAPPPPPLPRLATLVSASATACMTASDRMFRRFSRPRHAGSALCGPPAMPLKAGKGRASVAGLRKPEFRTAYYEPDEHLLKRHRPAGGRRHNHATASPDCQGSPRRHRHRSRVPTVVGRPQSDPYVGAGIVKTFQTTTYDPHIIGTSLAHGVIAGAVYP